jgi:hypothetical protein
MLAPIEHSYQIVICLGQSKTTAKNGKKDNKSGFLKKGAAHTTNPH